MTRLLGWSALSAAIAALALQPLEPAHSANKASSLQTVNGYADLADLALDAPMVVEAEIRKTYRIKAKESPGIPAGHGRYLVTAEVVRLISGRDALPSRINYLVDVPFDSRGKLPKLKNELALLFLKRGQSPGQMVLTGPHSQIARTEEAARTIRAILTEANANPRRFKITDVGDAFHVPGTIPGESETQIFLRTSDQRPVSLSVLRRPGEAPKWSVSLDEMVDESSAPAGRDTLLWYRLACFLPGQLPQSALENASPDEAEAIRADYRFILEQLGPCARQIKP